MFLGNQPGDILALDQDKNQGGIQDAGMVCGQKSASTSGYILDIDHNQLTEQPVEQAEKRLKNISYDHNINFTLKVYGYIQPIICPKALQERAGVFCSGCCKTPRNLLLSKMSEGINKVVKALNRDVGTTEGFNQMSV